MRLRLLLAGLLVLCPAAGPAQEPLQPGDLPPEIEIPIKQMRFDHATRIEAVFLYVDTYDDAIWVEWTAVHDGKRWYTIPDQRQFVVYPASPEMFVTFKALPKGTVLRMTIQRDKDGKRRIIFLESA
jgi:hypothetical protein